MVDFKIDGNDDDSVDEGASVAETPMEIQGDTPLIGLRKRREQIVNELYTDIQIPRWDEPELFIRFKPVSATK